MATFVKSFFPWFLYCIALITTSYFYLSSNLPFWDTLLLSVIVLNGGIECIWLGMSDLFFPTATAKSIGWEPCGFQTEAGGADLALGVTALLCLWNPSWLTPVSLFLIIFYSICAYAHIKDRLIHKNKASLNSGPMLYNTLIVIFTVCLCLIMQT